MLGSSGGKGEDKALVTTMTEAAGLNNVTLDDKYALGQGRVLMTGTQALVRLTMAQRQRDLAAGLNTAGYVTGYRGSPLGGLDRAMGRAAKFLNDHHVRLHPAVNEELAATAVWGTQQTNLFPGARYDGVFAMWYGKGPGVDRSGDAFRHGNMAGTAARGGVLLVFGDDPGCQSSTIPSASEFAMLDAQIPIFNPAGVQDVLDFGLYAWAMSRFSGCWTSLKVVADTVDSTATVQVGPGRVPIALPDDVELPPGGLNIRWPEDFRTPEERLHHFKLPAARAFIRTNGIDRRALGRAGARLGIVSTGKAFVDVMQALADLGIDRPTAETIGLSVYKVGVTWPLEPEGIRRFADGVDELFVVEEKRALLENQIKEQLYHLPADRRPRVVGKTDLQGGRLLSSTAELSPRDVALAIAGRLQGFGVDSFSARADRLRERGAAAHGPDIKRLPYFCAGCPHNTSTTVPEGSQAIAGIGCSTMALWMDRSTATFTHMGAEGANWIGRAPFVSDPHIFANMGDGTYFHSGVMAIRAAVAAGVNMTYKLLYNDAVAMTGGQPMDGSLSVERLAAQVAAEGVERIAIVAEDPGRHSRASFGDGASIHGRDDLDAVQRELRTWLGVSVLIYDQTCAAEKRRRRKRGRLDDPPRRAFINSRVCEGCGDCGEQSNCVAVEPLETAYGRKRAINQFSCNKDFSCTKGFCPSFVTVHGGRLRRSSAVDADRVPFPVLPDPAQPSLDETYGILVAGIGGTGIVTIGALLAMAAHLEGKAVNVFDQAGLAQKNGSVFSHVKIATRPGDIGPARIDAGGARLLLGCDIVTAGGPEGLLRLRPGYSRAAINSHETPLGDFTRDPHAMVPADALRAGIEQGVGTGAVAFLDASRLASRLMGDAVATNPFLLGFAHQRGLVPMSAAAIERAIEINDVAVDFNKQAFLWGRRTAHDRAAVERCLGDTVAAQPMSLDEVIAARSRDLVQYQDAAYARRYIALVGRVRAAETARTPGRDGLALAVAKTYYRLLAYKDEYEVARLYSDGTFLQELAEQFEGDVRLGFHMAPPLLSRRDPLSGHLLKREFGAWAMPAFRLLARLKRLRGTPLDIFGHSEERRMERRLIVDYERTADELLAKLTNDNHALAVEILALPAGITGFGHIKARHTGPVLAQQAKLLVAFHGAKPAVTAAE